jgi:hypothetical protein
LPIVVDAVIERGPGIAYRALCARDMGSYIEPVATGQVDRIPDHQIVDHGTLMGAGAHSASLRIDACPHYLIISSAREETTLVALRLSADPH